MYTRGLGVPIDFKQALTLFQAAASEGNGEAMAELARIWLFGYGCTGSDSRDVRDSRPQRRRKGCLPDHAKARSLFERSAALGDPGGKCGVAYMSLVSVLCEVCASFGHNFEPISLPEFFMVEASNGSARFPAGWYGRTTAGRPAWKSIVRRGRERWRPEGQCGAGLALRRVSGLWAGQ